MTDLDKAQAILAASNDGQDLPEHQRHIVMNAPAGRPRACHQDRVR